MGDYLLICSRGDGERQGKDFGESRVESDAYLRNVVNRRKLKF